MTAGESGLAALLDAQAGMVSRAQALSAGMTSSGVQHNLHRGRWIRSHPGVYRTYTGRPEELSRAWATVLYAGAGSMVGATETLAEAGLGRWPETLTVIVPSSRRVAPQPGLLVVRSRHADRWRAPASTLPRMRVEAAALMLVDRAATEVAAIDALITVTAGRRTTTSRLSAEVAAWPRLRRRRLVEDVLGDVDDGVASALERRWRRLEREHGLPPAKRNVAVESGGRRLYRDLDYDPLPVVAELDGRLYHPDIESFRDRARDNLAARQQKLTVRYGWREVVSDPCGCARELADVLRASGWQGQLRPCGSSCRAVRAA